MKVMKLREDRVGREGLAAMSKAALGQFRETKPLVVVVGNPSEHRKNSFRAVVGTEVIKGLGRRWELKEFIQTTLEKL